MNTIIIRPYGGLCNRMRYINGAYQYLCREQKKVKIICVWDINMEINSNTKTIFNLAEDINIKFVNVDNKTFFGKLMELTLKVLKKTKCYVDQLEFYHSDSEETKTLDEKEEDFRAFFKKKFVVLAGCEKIEKDYAENIFFPSKKIENMVSAALDEMNINEKNYVALHIRRTDHAWAIKNSPLEKFEDIANDMGEVKIFLATDDETVKNQFKDKFGEKIVTRNKISYDRNDKGGIEDAYVDLMLLSKSSHIYGSFASSFSEVGALLGDIPLTVVK